MGSNKKSLGDKMLSAAENIDDVDIDYDFSRDKYREILEHGLDLYPHLELIAKDSEHPRAFEVAFNALRQMADVNDKLLNMQRKKQVLDANKEQETNQGRLGFDDGDATDGEAPFKGTTAALLSAIDRAKRESIQDADFTEVQIERPKEDKDDT